MSEPTFTFSFAPGSVSLSRKNGKWELTRANEFEVMGLLCLRMLEGKGQQVTLADVSQLIEIRSEETHPKKGIQAIQVRRVVERMCARFKLPIATTSKKGYGGGWTIAQPKEIVVIVNNKEGDAASLRQVLGLDQQHVLWDESLPFDIPNPREIESIARQAVAIQVIHGHAPANAAGLRSRQVDPDSWPEEELLTFLSTAVALILPNDEGVLTSEPLRSRIKRQIVQRREEKQKEVALTFSAKLKHYLPDGDEAQAVLRSTAGMISDRNLRLAVLCNEARALRRTGELESAAKIMAKIEEECETVPRRYHDAVISASVSIERAWIEYLREDVLATYEQCEAKLIEFASSIGVGRYDTRLLLEYHLLAALCARRRAVLAKSSDVKESLIWVRRAFQHFNMALRQCLLTEDRELQVHTLGTLGDAIWDLGSKGLISDALDTAGFEDDKTVAVVALRIIGAAMLIARLGGANSGRHYALAYLLTVLGESDLTDTDFRVHNFSYEGAQLTHETIRGVAIQALDVPSLSPESRARISFGLAILENRCGMKNEANRRLLEMHRDFQYSISPRLSCRIMKTLSKWSRDVPEQEFALSP